MPRRAETYCTASALSWGSPLGGFGVGWGPEIVNQPPGRGADAGPGGCRGRWHRGTLGCEVGAPPARGEAGPTIISAALPLGGPGV
jgi:hypothetical protein